MSKFVDRLNGMKENWDQSENQYNSMFGGVKIPAGDYIARVQMVKLAEAKSSGKLMIKREHMIAEGAHTGSVVYDNMMLETPMGMSFVRKWFENMGYESPNDPSEIEDILVSINEEAALVKIAVKHSGDFTNVAVIEVIEEEDGSNSKEPEPEPEEKKETKKSQKSSKKTKKTKNKKAKSAPEPEPEEENPDEAALIKEMFIFCKAQDIETEESDDVEQLGERIREYDWPKAELTETELEMFETAGITDCIK